MNLPTEMLPNANEWRSNHRRAIEQRLSPAWNAPDLAQAFVTPIQGILIRREGTIVEMYCYDDASHTLSGIMSRIDLADPLHLLSRTAQAMMLSALWQMDDPNSVFIAGLGGGSLATQFRHCYPAAQIDASDIDGHIIELAETYFGFAEDENLTVRITDSREHLSQQDQTYSVIILDVFLGGGEQPNHLATSEFFSLCREKLESSGVIVANFSGEDLERDAKIAALQSTFSECWVLDHDGLKIVFGSNAALSLEMLSSRAAAFTEEYSFTFPFGEYLAHFKKIDASHLPAPLTDADL